MTYLAWRPDSSHAWQIRASDGTDVIALPYDTPVLVVQAIARAFTAESARLTEQENTT